LFPSLSRERSLAATILTASLWWEADSNKPFTHYRSHHHKFHEGFATKKTSPNQKTHNSAQSKMRNEKILPDKKMTPRKKKKKNHSPKQNTQQKERIKAVGHPPASPALRAAHTRRDFSGYES
jgi:hypothetical protein